MEVDSTPTSSREQTTPFLLRTFVKIGGFHRLTLFEDATLPTTDEIQLFSWKDATLREIVTTLRNTSPTTAEYRHPLARFSFRTVFADPTNKGRFAQKDLGMIYSRDILGDPGTIDTTAPRLLEDFDGERRELTEREKEERTLEELKFVPGDYLLVAVLFPKSVNFPSESKSTPANGWKGASHVGGSGAGKGDSGWGGTLAQAGGPPGRGGGHWRGGSEPQAGPRGGGGGRGRGGRDRDSERDTRDRRPPPPPRRGGDSPPPRGGRDRGRGGHGRRSRSPRDRRNSKYD